MVKIFGLKLFTCQTCGKNIGSSFRVKGEMLGTRVRSSRVFPWCALYKLTKKNLTSICYEKRDLFTRSRVGLTKLELDSTYQRSWRMRYSKDIFLCFKVLVQKLRVPIYYSSGI